MILAIASLCKFSPDVKSTQNVLARNNKEDWLTKYRYINPDTINKNEKPHLIGIFLSYQLMNDDEEDPQKY
jgi:hypothetical protein